MHNIAKALHIAICYENSIRSAGIVWGSKLQWLQHRQLLERMFAAAAARRNA